MAPTSPHHATVERRLDRRTLVTSAIVAALVHVGLAAVLQMSASAEHLPTDSYRAPVRGLCDGRRCPHQEVSVGRQTLDPGPAPELDLLEVALIPALGLKEPDPRQLPELVKYEQPETVQDGINIKNKKVEPKKIPRKENLPKPAEVDKRRKANSLDDLLAPRDDDPRKRASQLDRIIGTSRGSVHGSGATAKAGDPELAKLQRELQRRIVVPQMIPDAELRKLRFKFKLKLNADGTVEEFSVLRKSKSSQFNTAARAAIMRFMPRQGGTSRLPNIPDELRLNINAGHFHFVIDGRLYKR